MTQLGEGVAMSIDAPAGPEKCIFCGKTHQDEKAASAHTFPRVMSTLKDGGRAYTKDAKSGRSLYYPAVDKPPLVEWNSGIPTGGYKAAAHHCIALKTASNHKLSGEIHAAGYDPNRGSNCIWLPYSRPQFIRARALGRGLQKHRGGHTDAYFQTVAKHLDRLSTFVATTFCPSQEVCSKDEFLEVITTQENQIWNGVAKVVQNDYKLYNESYLDFKAMWGSFDEEKGHSSQDILGAVPNDGSAESDSAEDPE